MSEQVRLTCFGGGVTLWGSFPALHVVHRSGQVSLFRYATQQVCSLGCWSTSMERSACLFFSLRSSRLDRRWMRELVSRRSRPGTAGPCPGGSHQLRALDCRLPRGDDPVTVCVVCLFQSRVSVAAENLQLLPEGPDSAAPQLLSRTSQPTAFSFTTFHTFMAAFYRTDCRKWTHAVLLRAPLVYYILN